MILFYSETCKHCNVLLDTIKRHDTQKTIKLVVIDSIINKINHKISAVPALMFIPSKEIIYGKAVFDYLLLPNRGYLFTNNNTRDKKETTSITGITTSLNSKTNNEKTINEPGAFTLGSIIADSYSDITDDDINSMNINEDKIYKWGIIDNIENTPSNITENTKNLDSEKTSKKLPSIDELQKQRENIFKDI
jgi:hypothetical protein